MKNELPYPGQGRILVVDDEESICQFLQRGLAFRGYYVRHALDFDAVCCLLEAEPFDLVTLDIMMPEVDGLEILRWIKKRYPDVGVLMATALESLPTAIEAMQLGACDYLLKPLDLELVSLGIERAMERQRLVAENRSYQRELEKKVQDQSRLLEELEREIAERQRAEKDRQEAERLRVLVETAGGVAHEINQPLSVIVALSEYHLMDGDLNGRLRKGLEGVLQQAERISGIISRMANVKQYVTKPYIEGKNIVDFDFASQARESCP